MKLRELLTEVNTLVPNDIPPEVQISWMNQVQSSLYRYYSSSETPFEFVVQPTISFYDFPPDCIEDRVRRLVVGDENMEFIWADEDSELPTDMPFWTVFNQKIFLSPVPDKMQPATLYYLPSPTQLTIAALDDEVTFPADYIELLVLGCAVKVAIATKALDMAPLLQSQFLMLKDRAEQILGYKKQRRVNIVVPFQ